MRKVLGYIILSSPFLAFLVFYVHLAGIMFTLAMLGGLAVLAGVVTVGVILISSDEEK